MVAAPLVTMTPTPLRSDAQIIERWVLVGGRCRS